MKKLLKIISIIIVTGTIYFFVDPVTSIYVPKCPVKMLTGLDCPSCGSQRFLHALLNGRITEAFSYNIFLTISLPYFILLFIEWLLPNCKLKSLLRKWLWSRYTIIAFIILYFAWFIIRNIIGQ